MSYVPFCSVTTRFCDWPGSIVPEIRLETPGPSIWSECDSWPLSTATNVYVPGLNVCCESVRLNSRSVTVTFVPPELPPLLLWLELPQPASAATPSATATSFIGCRMTMMAVLRHSRSFGFLRGDHDLAGRDLWRASVQVGKI